MTESPVSIRDSKFANEIRTPQIETYHLKKDLDLRLLRKKGNERTFKGWLIQRMKDSRDNKNFDVTELIQTIYKKYLEFETSEKFKSNQWKGKSDVKYIESPDKIISIRYQKTEPFEQPKEIRLEITKFELENVIMALSHLFLEGNNGWIKTSTIAERVYLKKWDKVFSTRPEHIKLVEIFNYLEYKGIIDYKRSGKVYLKRKENLPLKSE